MFKRIIFVFMVAGFTSCVTVGYKPPIAPLKLTISPEGISIGAAPELVTPIGTFEIELTTPLVDFTKRYKQSTQIPRVLVVRIDTRVYVYRLKPNTPIRFEAEEDSRYFQRVVLIYSPDDINGDILLELETISVVPSPTPTPSPCAHSPKRLQIGKRAIVCTWKSGENLILRKGPAKSYPELRRLRPGAIVTITGEAVCDEVTGWWYWPVRTRSGYTGWMAEGGDNKDPYFLCPYDK